MIPHHESEFGSFDELLEHARNLPEYWIEGARNEFTEKVVQRMSEHGVTRSELAQRLNKKPSQITRLLRGDNNFTISTMVEIAEALGCHFHSHLEPYGYATQWVDIFDTAKDLSACALSSKPDGEEHDAEFTTAA